MVIDEFMRHFLTIQLSDGNLLNILFVLIYISILIQVESHSNV